MAAETLTPDMAIVQQRTVATGPNFSVHLIHGPGFTLLHRVVALDAEGATCEFDYTGAEKLDLADHFPGNPIMPGVLVQEVGNQTLAQLLQVLPELQGCTYRLHENRLKLTGHPVTPGSTLVARTRTTDFFDRLGQHFGKGKCDICVDHKRVAIVSITFSVHRQSQESAD